jgi:hypothetical protein
MVEFAICVGEKLLKNPYFEECRWSLDKMKNPQNSSINVPYVDVDVGVEC